MFSKQKSKNIGTPSMGNEKLPPPTPSGVYGYITFPWKCESGTSHAHFHWTPTNNFSDIFHGTH